MFDLSVVLEEADVVGRVVVSMRRMQPTLSYILIEALPKRCLMQVPSMRVENCEPTS